MTAAEARREYMRRYYLARREKLLPELRERYAADDEWRAAKRAKARARYRSDEHFAAVMIDRCRQRASKQGVPNLYGLIQGPANVIAPGKRPLSSMVPTIVVKDGKPFLVLGSPGGARIPTTVANILMGVIDYGMDIQEAVNAPRFHHQWEPDQISVEQWFSPDTVEKLRQMGHKVFIGVQYEEWEPRWSDGECVAVNPKTGERLGASDNRNDGKAVGF